MTALPKKRYVSPEEYLASEREALEKHEYLDGEVFAMAGAKAAHVEICSNLMINLGSQLREKNCRAYQSDLRTHIPKTGLYTYPDIIVVCGKAELVPDGHLDTLLNPTLIIEVLSPSTADYDRGAKFDHYKTIETLKEYVLVWQNKRRVARNTRHDDDSWLLTDFIGEDSEVELSSIGCTLTMAEIYDRVEGLEPQ
jgi:Uma2 family endonuclease